MQWAKVPRDDVVSAYQRARSEICSKLVSISTSLERPLNAMRVMLSFLYANMSSRHETNAVHKSIITIPPMLVVYLCNADANDVYNVLRVLQIFALDAASMRMPSFQFMFKVDIALHSQ